MILDLSIISIISRIHLVFSASEGPREDVVQSEFELIADEVVGNGNVLRGIIWAIIEDMFAEEAEYGLEPSMEDVEEAE